MEINKTTNGNELNLCLKGSLDTETSPLLEETIASSLNGIQSLIFDFKDLDYVSSAGLRVLLVAQKIMGKQGKMVIKNVNEEIMDIFDMTVFSSILDIEN